MIYILVLSYKNGLSTSVVYMKTFFIVGIKVPANTGSLNKTVLYFRVYFQLNSCMVELGAWVKPGQLFLWGYRRTLKERTCL